MNAATRSSIFQLSPVDWRPGYCWVCDQLRTLKFRDVTTGQCIGACCLEHLLIADRALTIASADGIRKPHPGDDSIPNH